MLCCGLIKEQWLPCLVNLTITASLKHACFRRDGGKGRDKRSGTCAGKGTEGEWCAQVNVLLFMCFPLLKARKGVWLISFPVFQTEETQRLQVFAWLGLGLWPVACFGLIDEVGGKKGWKMRACGRERRRGENNEKKKRRRQCPSEWWKQMCTSVRCGTNGSTSG